MPNEQFDEQAWAGMLEQYNEEFQESRRSSWMPDDGDYLVILKEIRRVMYKQDERMVPALAPVVTILDGRFEGQEFEMGLFPPSRLGFLGAVVHPATGEVPTSLSDFFKALTATIGQVLRVNVSTSKIKKGRRTGQTVKNARIMDYVHEETPAPPTEA